MNVQTAVAHPARGGPWIDVGAVPWSRRGSFMALSTLATRPDLPSQGVEPGLFVFDVSGSRRNRWGGVFRIEAAPGTSAASGTSAAPGTAAKPVEVRSATPARLDLGLDAGQAQIAWDGPDTLRLRGSGAGLRLVETTGGNAIVISCSANAWRLQMAEDAHYTLTCLRGRAVVTGPKVRGDRSAGAGPNTVTVVPDDDGYFEFALTQYESAYVAPAAWRGFEDCVDEVADEFGHWLAAHPAVPTGLDEAAALAAYVQWSTLVRPRGILRRPAMLMSKNWMNAVWSWDHCFNAIGLADTDPDLAWDQFMLPFDHQHPSGALPDVVHDNGRIWGFVKPPVHGWTLTRLRRAGVVSDARLAEIYPRLTEWTEFWLTFRDDDGDGLCEYLDGCDSGQDNTTAFDQIGFPAAAPDLAALLILQMDALSDVAGLLDDAAGETRWRERADAMSVLLLDKLWDGTAFRILHAGDAGVSPAGHDQFGYLPLVLGPRLPEQVRSVLIERLRTSGLLTEFGLASESPQSPCYQADGYWRGPIWAPTTFLVADGLAACGEQELAGELAQRFLQTCKLSGFAENYEATTGRPLRDPAYTWSASTFWALAVGLTTPTNDER